MANVNDEFDRLLTTLDVDDVADDVDQAGQYVEWFTANALKIVEFEHRGLGFENAVILRNLWARFGRAQYALMQYAQSQKKRDSEPETIDIYNSGHRAFYINDMRWKWYNLLGNTNSNFPIDIRNTTKDMHGKRAVQLVSYYIRRDRNYVHK